MGLTRLPRVVGHPLPLTPHNLFQKHELILLLKVLDFILSQAFVICVVPSD